jgi:large subunit ribosomal protein L25
LKNIELKATTRTTKGNSPARAVRREGRIPAILYGPATDPMMLSLDGHEFDLLIKQGNIGQTVFNIVIDDGKITKSAMVKELQAHPVSQAFLHVDLYEISMDRKIRVNVPVITTGVCKGVELGGMLQLIRRELEVYCYPGAIPEAITIDITELDTGDSVHVEDIHLEGDVEIPHDVNFTILTIVSTKAEVAEEGEEGEEGGADETEAETAE